MVLLSSNGQQHRLAAYILRRSINCYECDRLLLVPSRKIVNCSATKRTLATRIIINSNNTTNYDTTNTMMNNDASSKKSSSTTTKFDRDQTRNEQEQEHQQLQQSYEEISRKGITSTNVVTTDVTSGSTATPNNSAGNSNNNDPPAPPPIKTNFMDGTVAYESKSVSELLRAMTVFTVLQYTPSIIIKNAEKILHYVQTYVLGTRLTNLLLRHTLFNQFCAGENEATIQQPIHKLQHAGIGCILDYAAEATTINSSSSSTPTNNNNDSSSDTKATSSTPSDPDVLEQESSSNYITMVRTYDYESERVCDNHTRNFQKCIEDAAVIAASMPTPSSTSNPTIVDDAFRHYEDYHPPLPPYAAIKITALGNPLLLKRLSQAIQEIHQFFQKLDTNQDGYITLDDFQKGLDQHFHPTFHPIFQERIEYLFAKNDPTNPAVSSSVSEKETTYINYETFTQFFTLDDLPALTAGCKVAGPLQMATPTAEEIQLLHALRDRVHKLADVASSNGTRLLIDAEQSWYQPAIDNIVFELQRIYNHPTNSPYPIVYNTYQMYLKDSLYRLQNDYQRSYQCQYHFGAKLVRGAYMEQERAVAAAAGIPSPIHDTFQDTHTNYNTALEYILKHYYQYQQEQQQQKQNNNDDQSIPSLQTEIMCATHNTESIELAVRCMKEFGIAPTSQTVSFAQLYGMMDPVTYNLGYDGYRAYKYVPYGEIQMVIPYLLRRAAENSAIASTTSTNREMYMLRQELQRRILFRHRR